VPAARFERSNFRRLSAGGVPSTRRVREEPFVAVGVAESMKVSAVAVYVVVVTESGVVALALLEASEKLFAASKAFTT
jgi:hypothetical protein